MRPIFMPRSLVIKGMGAAERVCESSADGNRVFSQSFLHSISESQDACGVMRNKRQDFECPSQPNIYELDSFWHRYVVGR